MTSRFADASSHTSPPLCGGECAWRFSSFPTAKRWALKRRRAFTLIELILALVMVAALAASLYASLQTAFKAKASAEGAVEPYRTGDLAMQLIQQDIQNSLPPGDVLQGNFEGTQGTGGNGNEADDLNFYTTADSPQHVDANGEVKNVELTVIQPQNSSDYVLVRRVKRNLLSQTTVTPDTEVICRNVGNFTCQYYDGSEWLQSWDSTAEDNTLPVAVQVTLELQRPTPNGKGTRTFKFTRIIPISCSTAAFDAQVNPNATSTQ
jgi:type II secretion system protein J